MTRTTSLSAAEVAAALRALGIPATRLSEPNDVEDGAVTLAVPYHVQVGRDGAVTLVAELHDGTLKFWPTRSTIDALARDVRSLRQNLSRR